MSTSARLAGALLLGTLLSSPPAGTSSPASEAPPAEADTRVPELEAPRGATPPDAPAPADDATEAAPPTPPRPPSPTRVTFVVDASGSMNHSLGSGLVSRIAAARIAVREATLALAGHPDFSVQVLVFGPAGCGAVQTLPATVRGETAATLRRLAAVGAYGPSSLAAAVLTAEQLLLQWSGRRVLVVLTDGADSCGSDLASLALHDDVERHVLGLAVSAETAGQLLALGEYTEIRSPTDLTVALSRITGDVLDAPPIAAEADHSTSR